MTKIHVVPGARGFDFISEQLQRNVKQVNAVHGDTPKSSIPKVPPNPKKPAFCGLKNMEILAVGSGTNDASIVHGVSTNAETKEISVDTTPDVEQSVANYDVYGHNEQVQC